MKRACRGVLWVRVLEKMEIRFGQEGSDPGVVSLLWRLIGGKK